MAEDKRRSFYQMAYQATGKPIWMEDMGNVLSISGLLIEGMGTHVLVLTPGANDNFEMVDIVLIQPSIEEWCELLRISDDPYIYEQDATGTIKAIHRKVERAISGAIQQKIWWRDGFQCIYCWKSIADGVQQTIDHFVPIDLGGEEREDNYITCCRQCGKRKGNRDPQEFCKAEGLDYEGIVLYLQGKAPKSFISR